MSEQHETPAKRKRSITKEKQLTERNQKRAKVDPDKSCLLLDEINFQANIQVSDPELNSLVNSELLDDIEPELSDLSENAAQNASTQKQ